MATFAVLALVGCGAARGAAGGHADPALKTAECMRAHGVPDFPDPAAGGPLVIPNGLNTDAPDFQSAQSTCSRLLPVGLQDGRKASESAKLAMFAIARCIRTHGVPSFPDPTATPPASPPARGVALGRGGVFLVVADPQAPAFKHAAAACHFGLPR